MTSDDAESGGRRRWFKILGPSTTVDVTDREDAMPADEAAAVDTVAEDIHVESDEVVVESPAEATPAAPAAKEPAATDEIVLADEEAPDSISSMRAKGGEELEPITLPRVISIANQK